MIFSVQSVIRYWTSMNIKFMDHLTMKSMKIIFKEKLFETRVDLEKQLKSNFFLGNKNTQNSWINLGIKMLRKNHSIKGDDEVYVIIYVLVL